MIATLRIREGGLKSALEWSTMQEDVTLSTGMEVLVVALSSSEGGSWCGQWEGKRGMFSSTKSIDGQVDR